MTTPSPTKRVPLGELPPNAISPRPRSPRDFLKTKDAVVEIFRPGSPLKQTYLAETQSSGGPEIESRGKKRKAGDDNGVYAEEAKVVSPVLLRGSSEDMPAATEIETTSTIYQHHPAHEHDRSGSSTPTPDNQITPQESSASKISGSFSSLIDYDPRGSSQRGSSPTDCTTCEAPAALVSIQSKTEMLRLRLRVAMYKVQTNQTRLPLYALTLPAPKPITPEVWSRTPSPMQTTPRSRSLPAESAGIQERRAKSNEDSLATPVAKRLRLGADLDEEINAKREESGWDKLTSSVVKGKIAAGLLELRRAS
ncbi:hypothetical protein EJ05DRAFT_372141 [Pseudovirgaria hyperparasitica]|uniref:Uncharacterized protein n=1 Tax=Pseudovirgaria hyperparasitica TaxID=470096 RepID=A0A6A6W8M4_9PEZI|nr:uncharacterized protein EJ05DRAFT_372141 [Pseudovirgaria hyperparasitica]KAF2757927.1 hypothetical protein EJ05DRAFT_372141 [Pseudovirgaria hyperparasitica]